ncbi:hypothetical protein FK220_014170 [Flavobacteriaceae bacterium TP-CH-4]|uniref:Uncharacterized protein n=1 Tax=Pelagihabitans pacificus TaxID=2696054 RepID=A0A967E6G5_9FLAO|nr:hypothetical protein [Pelagihabitans pacificus]NHF60497.1 hypothetical protein [Pelagihabitans pacificus]
MRRFFFFWASLLLISSCKQEQSETVASDTVSFEITTEKWPKKTALNAKAQSILNDWVEYKALETSFDVLYTVENREDLSLVIEGLIEKQKELESSEYPTPFDKPQIKGRQKMFKTFVLKVKGDLIYRLDTENSVLEMIAAYNAFRDQFNIIVNNTLDTKLILDK